MQLQLSQLVPIPIREKISNRQSDVWLKELSISRGERIFIQAPSGTGKTTFIHMLYGLRYDFDGRISWNGKPLSAAQREDWAEIRQKELSVVFQDLRLFSDLSAWENLEIKRNLTNTVTEDEMAQWLERLGLKDKRNSLGQTLSYGEQQRVAIIRALLQPFQWLLMDEPFSHLDKANTAKAAALIQEVADRNNAGFILVDLDENDYFPYTKTMML
ncbi:ATP-binding cassette domain-containing protein [Taibaiella soli]|uniref:ABC transporter n=1 Tax=Taibaiella soli TaxID=1649169 RepID=A0A2W2BBT2_9BACT|nr:ATP-binding cassette domain-containing protein [Taibaiella soli]PZF73347.1 ABC transporter [Taibaiella soli]